MPIYKIIGSEWSLDKKLIISIAETGSDRSAASSLAKKLGLDTLSGCRVFLCDLPDPTSDSSNNNNENSNNPVPRREIDVDVPLREQQVASMSYLYVIRQGEKVPDTVVGAASGSGNNNNNSTATLQPSSASASTTTDNTTGSALTANVDEILAASSSTATATGTSITVATSNNTKNDVAESSSLSANTAKPPVAPVSTSNSIINNNSNKQKEEELLAKLEQERKQREQYEQQVKALLAKQEEDQKRRREEQQQAQKEQEESQRASRQKEQEILQQLSSRVNPSDSGQQQQQQQTPAISPVPKKQHTDDDDNLPQHQNISTTTTTSSSATRYGFAWELLKKRQQKKHENLTNEALSSSAVDMTDDASFTSSTSSSRRALALANSRLGALPYRSPHRQPSPHHYQPSTVEQIDQIAVAAELAAGMRLQKEQEMIANGYSPSNNNNSPGARTSVINVADDSQLKDLISEVAHKTVEESAKDEEQRRAEYRKKELEELEEQRKQQQQEEEKRHREQRQKEQEETAALLEKQRRELEEVIRKQEETLKRQQEEAEARRQKEKTEEEEKKKELATKEDLVRLQARIDQLLQVQENLTKKIEERPVVVEPQQQQQQPNVSVSPAVPILAQSPAMKTQHQIDRERQQQQEQQQQQQQKLSLLQQQRNARKEQQQQLEQEQTNANPQNEVDSLLEPQDNISTTKKNLPSLKNTKKTESDFDSHFQSVMESMPTPIRKEEPQQPQQSSLMSKKQQQQQQQNNNEPSFEIHTTAATTNMDQQQQQRASNKSSTTTTRSGIRQPRGSQNSNKTNHNNTASSSRASSRATSRSSSVNNNNNQQGKNNSNSLLVVDPSSSSTSHQHHRGSAINNQIQSYTAPTMKKGARPDNYQPPADIDDFSRSNAAADDDDDGSYHYYNQSSFGRTTNQQQQISSSSSSPAITMQESMDLLNEGAHKFLVNDRRVIRDWISRVANKPLQQKLMMTANNQNQQQPLINVSDTIVPDVAITLVANSPQFIRAIIVPLIIDQISAAIDRRGNVVGPDGNKQKFSQLLSAIAGLGKLASDCYPLLRTWAKLGAENADKALLALALRSTGGMLAVTDAVATLKSEGASAAARNIAAYSLGLLAVDGTSSPNYRRTRVFVFDSPVLEDAAVAASRAGAKGVLSLVQLEKPSAPSPSSSHSALDQRTAHHKLPRYARTCILISRQAALKRALEFLSSPQSQPYNSPGRNIRTAAGDDDDDDLVDGANWMVPPVAPKNLIDQHVETAKQLAEPLQMTDLGLPSWLDSSSSGSGYDNNNPVILTDAGVVFDGNYEQLVADTQSKQVDPQLLPLRDVGLHLVSLLETDDTDSSGSVQELVLLAIPKLPRESRALILEPLLRTFPGLLHMHGDTHPRVIAAAATALGDSVAVVGAAAHPTLCEDAQAVLCNLIAPSSDVIIATAACEALAMMANSIHDDAPATRIFWAWEKHRLLTADSVAAALVALRAADTIAQHILYCVTAVANHGGDRGLLHRCTALVDATAEHLTYDLCSPNVAANFIEAFLGALRMLPTETAFCVSCIRGLARIGVNPGSVPCERLDEAVTVAKTTAPPLPYWEELETVIESDLYAPPIKISICESLVKEGGAAGEVKVTRMMLRHAFPWIRASAARALRHSAGTPVVSLLLAANDTDPSVREAALETLEGLTQERVAEALATVQRDRVKAVAQCARDFLQFGTAEIVSLTLQICESIMEMEPRQY